MDSGVGLLKKGVEQPPGGAGFGSIQNQRIDLLVVDSFSGEEYWFLFAEDICIKKVKEEVIRRIWGSAYLPDLERGKNSVSLLLSDGTPLKDSFRINSYPQLFTGQAPDPETKDGRALMEEIFLFGQHFLDSSPRPTPPREIKTPRPQSPKTGLVDPSSTNVFFDLIRLDAAVMNRRAETGRIICKDMNERGLYMGARRRAFHRQLQATQVLLKNFLAALSQFDESFSKFDGEYTKKSAGYLDAMKKVRETLLTIKQAEIPAPFNGKMDEKMINLVGTESELLDFASRASNSFEVFVARYQKMLDSRNVVMPKFAELEESVKNKQKQFLKEEEGKEEGKEEEEGDPDFSKFDIQNATDGKLKSLAEWHSQMIKQAEDLNRKISELEEKSLGELNMKHERLKGGTPWELKKQFEETIQTQNEMMEELDQFEKKSTDALRHFEGLKRVGTALLCDVSRQMCQIYGSISKSAQELHVLSVSWETITKQFEYISCIRDLPKILDDCVLELHRRKVWTDYFDAWILPHQKDLMNALEEEATRRMEFESEHLMPNGLKEFFQRKMPGLDIDRWCENLRSTIPSSHDLYNPQILDEVRQKYEGVDWTASDLKRSHELIEELETQVEIIRNEYEEKEQQIRAELENRLHVQAQEFDSFEHDLEARKIENEQLILQKKREVGELQEVIAKLEGELENVKVEGTKEFDFLKETSDRLIFNLKQDLAEKDQEIARLRSAQLDSDVGRKGEIGQLNSQVQSLGSQTRELKNEISGLKEEKNRLSHDKKKLEGEKKKLEDEKKKWEDEKRKWEDEKRKSEEEKKKLKREKNALNDEKQKISSDNRKLSGEVEKSLEENKKLNKTFSDEKKKMDDEKQKLSATNKKLVEDTRKAHAENQKMKGQIQDIQGALKKACEEKEKSVSKLRDEIQILETKNVSLNQQFERFKKERGQPGSPKIEEEERIALVSELEKELRKIDVERREMVERLEASETFARARIESLEVKEKELEEEAKGTQLLFTEYFEEIEKKILLAGAEVGKFTKPAFDAEHSLRFSEAHHLLSANSILFDQFLEFMQEEHRKLTDATMAKSHQILKLESQLVDVRAQFDECKTITDNSVLVRVGDSLPQNARVCFIPRPTNPKIYQLLCSSKNLFLLSRESLEVAQQFTSASKPIFGTVVYVMEADEQDKAQHPDIKASFSLVTISVSL